MSATESKLSPQSPTDHPTWLPENGQLLLSLREQARVDAFVFAKLNTVSTAQLKELETGEGNSFYNPKIKLNTGLKLLTKLGHTQPAIASPNRDTQVDSRARCDKESTSAPHWPAATSKTPRQPRTPHSQTSGFLSNHVVWILAVVLLAAVGFTARDGSEKNTLATKPTSLTRVNIALTPAHSPACFDCSKRSLSSSTPGFGA